MCSADVRKPARDWQNVTTNNISYFVGASARESLPQSFLAGDRNVTLNGNRLSRRVELTNGAPVAWDEKIHRSQGTVALGDGSVQQLSSGRLREALENTGV